MLFNSFQYFLFLPITAILFFHTPYHWRWLVLLIASCIFYMAFVPKYILILFVVIAVDYICGLQIEERSGRVKQIFLLISIFSNLGLLCFFKYTNFLLSNLGLPYHINIILPIGLSFHVFQSLSYTIEVYLGRYRAETHLGHFAVYVLFFPQMVAGPIERPQNILPQLRLHHDFSFERLAQGFQQIVYGLFKKVVVADTLAQYVDALFKSSHHASGEAHLIGAFAFSIQIYCDFSGYSDIALGSAHIFGIKLMQNFRFPYFSTSLREFWTRWHISLSTWFRDYLYIPLGGNRNGALRNDLNLVLVFLLSGLWHGANWTFVIWGGIHAFFLMIAKALGRLPAVPGFVRGVIVFGVVTLAWVFFRAPSFSEALIVFKQIFFHFRPSEEFLKPTAFLPVRLSFQVLAGVLLLFLGMEVVRCNRTLLERYFSMPYAIRSGVTYAGILLILLFWKTEGKQFIYFQF